MANDFIDKLINPTVAKLAETYARTRAIEISDLNVMFASICCGGIPE